MFVKEACDLFAELKMEPFLDEARQLAEQLQPQASFGSAPKAQSSMPRLNEEKSTLPRGGSMGQIDNRVPFLPMAENVFRQEGDLWLLSYQGESCLLKDMKGLHVIAYLLRYPNEQFDVMLLSTFGSGMLTDSAESMVNRVEKHTLPLDGLRLGTHARAEGCLDAQARSAYRRRLAELHADLSEAEQFHDLGRAAKNRAEIEFLLTELRVTTGLGGRVRSMNSPNERARLGVRKAITTAIRHIKAKHASLASHLASSVRTGTRCWYVSDPTRPLLWVV